MKDMKEAVPVEAIRKSFFDGKFNFKNLFSFDVSKHGNLDATFHSFTKSPNFNKGIEELEDKYIEARNKFEKDLYTFIDRNVNDL